MSFLNEGRIEAVRVRTKFGRETGMDVRRAVRLFVSIQILLLHIGRENIHMTPCGQSEPKYGPLISGFLRILDGKASPEMTPYHD